MKSCKFKVGDRVDVTDRRDRTVVDRDVEIKHIELFWPAGGPKPKWYCTLSCGYAAHESCLSLTKK